MQPQPEQIQVDPTGVINHQRAMAGQLFGQLINDLAVTRALLDDALAEVERLTRVADSLRGENTPSGSGDGG